MNITKKNNYLHVTDIENFAEAVSECYKEYENGYFAAVFEKGSAALDADTKKALADAPFTTAVHTDDLFASAVEDLLCFDLRFTSEILKADKETVKKLSENENFRILFSDKRVFELKKYAISDSSDEIELGYFSVTEESIDEYFERIYKEKTPFQIKALTECLVALRKGKPELGFDKESVNFYKLIKETTKE